MPQRDPRRLRALLAMIALAALGACSQAPTKQASRAHGMSPAGGNNLGAAQGYLGQHQDARAMEYARLALQTDPDAPEVHVVIALIQQADGEQAKAGKSFSRALKLAPGSGMVLNAHAAWLCGQGQVDAADLEFARALRDPGYQMPMQAVANAGMCAHKAGRWPKAEQYFRHALEFAPEDPKLLYLLADTELRQGHLLEARAFVQRRDALGADAATLDLAARIEDATGDSASASRLRQRRRDQFPEGVPGAATP